jgi:hypothetical protein
MPRIPSSSSSLVQERGLPLNLPEPLGSERRQELAIQQTKGTETLAPTGAGMPLERRTPSPRSGKPQLSVSVPPRQERGLRPLSYDGPGGGAYEFDAADEEDLPNEADEGEDKEDNDGEDNEQLTDSLVVPLSKSTFTRSSLD